MLIVCNLHKWMAVNLHTRERPRAKAFIYLHIHIYVEKEVYIVYLKYLGEI
jgi:hypothetical protein